MVPFFDAILDFDRPTVNLLVNPLRALLHVGDQSRIVFGLSGIIAPSGQRLIACLAPCVHGKSFSHEAADKPPEIVSNRSIGSHPLRRRRQSVPFSLTVECQQ
jgi:hypothetical protein